MDRRTRVSIVALAFCAVIHNTSQIQADEPISKFGREGTVKLRITDASMLPVLQQLDGRVVEDYGSFTVVEVPATTVSQIVGAELIERENLILLNAGAIDTTSAFAKSLQTPRQPFEGKALHLVQFAGPVTPTWYSVLENTGVDIVTYIPNNAYLVYGDATALSEVQSLASALPQIQWEGAYLDEYKIDPSALGPTFINPDAVAGHDMFAIQLVADESANAKTLEVIDRLKLAPIQTAQRVLNYFNIVVRIAPENLARLAQQPEIVSIQPYYMPEMLDERQDQIVAGNLTGNNPTGPGYLAWLGTKGFTQAQFTTSAFAVDVTDSGIDNATTSPNHFGLYVNGTRPGTSRVAYNRLVGTPNGGSTLRGCDGHGTLNSHVIAGYNDLSASPHTDASGFRYGLGVAPFVRVGSSVIFDDSSYTNPNLTNLQSMAYNDNARISSNSWGNTVSSAYTTDSQTYDALVRDAQPTGSTFPNAGNQQMVIVFANGNSGSGAGTVRAPATAKNVISVGAAENVQAFGGADGCGTTDSEANSANDIVGFSSRGPCPDGRKKPDIVAPGTHVSGGVIQTASPASTGTADACFDATGVCGGSGSNFFPSGQQWYTASSGTSHSTPCVAGGAALLRQFFINQGMSAPSPAMTKAILMNSARYMNGTGANDTLWSNNQGMGMMHLGEAFNRGAVTPTIFRDQVAVDMFTATGQTRTFTGTISDTSKPFRVTLVWTDAPGPTSGAAYKNNLDLTITLGANTYRGNVFTGANSTTGGSADTVNNVESVFLPAGTGGSFTATVTATSINSDGVPNVGGALDQDFALVAYNATTAAVPVISGISSSITAQSCSPGNSAIDPDEVVTVDFTLQNVGSANTTNVVATLQATGGVTSPSAAQNYGALTAGGASATRSFSFTASGTCGATLIATLQIQDGASNLGNITFNFTLGSNGVSFTQNFDGVSAPALPAGWAATIGSGSPTLWVTNSTSSDTAPNALFASDPTTTTDNRITSPTIAINSAASTFSFRHSYVTESTWDGGVLEISIAGGAFTDILTAGGSFTAGGYTSTLQSSANPLTGRAAWNGNSGGFVTTTGTFPPSAAGQNVQLRWRLGSDSSIGGTGWRVDTLSISQPTCCSNPCPGGTPATPTNQIATPASVCVGTSSSLTATVGAGETVDWYTASCGGTLVGSGSGLSVSPAATTTYFARARNTTSGCVSASCASATVTVNTPPAAPTSPTATPSSICAGTSSSLSATVPGGITVDWYTGSCGGTLVAGGANPSVSPASTTTYFARARNSTTGCVSATCASVTVTVNSLPATPTSPLATPASICPGASSTLSATVPGGVTVDWFTGSCGGTSVSGGANPSVSPASTTTYFARARNTTSACNSAACASVTVTVNTPPAAPTSPTATPATICSGGSSTLTASVPGGVTVDWFTVSCGGTPVPGGASPSVSPATTTTYFARARNSTTSCISTACASVIVTVADITAPVISQCAPNQSANADANCQAAVPDFRPGVVATDNCTAPGSLIVTQSPPVGTLVGIGPSAITLTVTDAANNPINCGATFTVSDMMLPSFANCPANIGPVPTDAGQMTAVVNWTPPTASDNCSTPTVGSSHNPGFAFPIGTTSVTYTATDGAGNIQTCSFTVTVLDLEAPSIQGCPGTITLSADAGECDATASWIPPTVTDNAPGASISQIEGPASGSAFPAGTTTVRYLATDSAGNTALCFFNVIVADDENPVFADCPGNISIGTTAPGCDATATWTEPTASDNCAIANVSSTHNSGDTFPLGTTQVVYTALDVNGRQATCSFNVTVNDDDAPTITTCAGNQQASTDANCQATVPDFTAGVIATDNCTAAGSLTVTQSPSAGTLVSGGPVTVTITVADGAGNLATCDATLTLADSTVPTITTCAGNQNMTPDENCEAAVPDFTAGVVGQDNCTSAGGLVITQSPTIGTLVGGGPTTITVTVTDGAGNAATCEATLTVADTTAPTLIDCPANLTVNSNAPNCAAVVTWTAPTASDNCAGASVAQTEGPISGSTFANGSTTTITYTATDASSLTATCSFTVTVAATADINNDGQVDFDDIAPFIDVLIDANTNVPDIYRADVNCDGLADGRDIEPFAVLLVGP